MAEINVPAWPMPIHQTKLRISMPQATGMLTPQRPMPLKTRLVMVNSSSWNRANEIAKPMNQANDVLRFKTIELILSVTDANVSPGSITGDVECIGPSVYGFCGSSAMFDVFDMLQLVVVSIRQASSRSQRQTKVYRTSGFGFFNCVR